MNKRNHEFHISHENKWTMSALGKNIRKIWVIRG